MKRRTRRVSIVLGVLVALALLGSLRFSGWKREATARLEAGSTLLQTALGPIEYATLGEGPVVLVSHGALGGYDQGLIIGRLVETRRFKLIAPSRAGYLRSPLASGRSPQQQADAFAALLDRLKVPGAAMVGVSAGGPSALQFALLHPDRCWGLILLSAISNQLVVPEEAHPAAISLLTSFADLGGWWISEAMRWQPRSVARALLSPAEVRALEDPRKMESLRQLVNSFFPFSLRRKGFLNDAYIETLEPVPFGEIGAPTLVIHGTADEVVPLAQAESAARGIPGAELAEIAGGGHLAGVIHQDRVGPMIEAFLSAHAPGG